MTPLLALLLLLSFSPASAQFTLLYQKDGDTAGINLGTSVAGAGDVNGDGRADFIIGASAANPGGLLFAGSAFVYSGADGSFLFQKNGAALGDRLGQSVASAGDVNGDGRADFIIGATFADPAGPNSGSAFVYSGANGSLLFQKDGTAGDNLGISVASAGDVNGDGRADYIIGAHLADPGGLGDAGSAYVYSGATGALLYQKDGAAIGDRLGVSVASAGDVNGDGRADFIVGADFADPGSRDTAGSAYVYSGATGSLLYQKDGAATGDRLGLSVASAGDVNGDGRPDFIVGAFVADPGGLNAAGSAYVYSGATGLLLYQMDGTTAGDVFGARVAGGGDVNGDGKADFIIGAKLADPGGFSNAGSAYVYSGANGSLLFQKDGSAVDDFLGASVASAGDVNGDGRADVIISADFADPGGQTDAGSAFVYGLPPPPDPPVNLTLIHQKNGTAPFDRIGAVANAGDVDGDGKDDFIVTADMGLGLVFVYSGATGLLLHQKNVPSSNVPVPIAGAGDVNGDGRADFIVGESGTNTLTGSAYVYSGANGNLLYQKDGTFAGDEFGWSVAGAGDVNGDGRADFIIGARAAAGGAENGSAYVYSGATGTLLYQKDATDSAAQLGYSVAGAGDVNGDGKSDFIISAPFTSTATGSAYVYSGATGTLLYQKDGTVANERFGESVAGVGDVNGDGRADFIVGGWLAEPGGLTEAGSAYLYSGADGSLLFQKNGNLGDRFGKSVAGVGDVNGDGRADFAVGGFLADPGGRTDAGSAYFYSGATGTLLFQKDGPIAGDNLGVSVAGGGDVNGDGKADILVGALFATVGGQTQAGSVFVFVGGNRKPLLAPIGNPTGTEGQLLTFTFFATDPDGFLPALSVMDTSTGMAVVDSGGGFGSFVWTPQPYQVGNHTVRFIASDGFLSDTQAVTITVLADTLKDKKNGANPNDQFGFALSGGGDVDNDGVADYIIGAPFADVQLAGEAVVLADAGSAYVYSGKNDTLIYQVNGTAIGDRLGGSVGLVGDANEDGRADFIVGAPGKNDSAGAIYLYSGLNGMLLFQKNGAGIGDRLGGSVGLVGDMNLDGNDDFAAGAPGFNGSAGALYVYSGADGSPLFPPIIGGASGDRLGGSVGITAETGDFNGDGRADFVVGADGVNGSRGAAYIYSGADGNLLRTIPGAVMGDRLGGSVGFTFVDDVNGDSRADYVIGAPGAGDSAGAVYVYSGLSGNLLFQKPGGAAGDRLGGSVGIQADVDGDGGADFIAGAPGTNDSAGAAFIYSGATGDLLVQKSGDSTGDRLGGSVGIFNDASGLAHFVIGAPNANPGGNQDAGSAFIFQTVTKGDLDGDGLLTSTDVVLMLNCVFLGLGNCAVSFADLDCEGELTSTDVVMLLNAVFLGTPIVCQFE